MRLATALTSAALTGILLVSGSALANAAPKDLPAVEAKEFTDASSLLALINPETKLSPATYVPKNLSSAAGTSHTLRPEAAEAVESLIAGARKAGYSIKLLSAYRSYDRQAVLFNQYQNKYGTAYAERISARPGTSEHQLGLAADVGNSSGANELRADFGSDPAGIWIAEHAADYGLIVRYPEGKEAITGYKYEPWHVRFIGKEHAAAMKASKAETFEEYQELLRQAAKETKKESSAAAKASEEAKAKKAKEKAESVSPLKDDDLLVLRFLPPYRDWGFGFTNE